jgi:hypothetical protein
VQQEGASSSPFFNGTQLNVYICAGANGGATTISWNSIGTIVGGTSGSIGIYEFTPFSGGTGTTGFRLITPPGHS